MPYELNHPDIIRQLADRDPASFAAEGGWEHCRNLTLTIGDEPTATAPHFESTDSASPADRAADVPPVSAIDHGSKTAKDLFGE